MGSHYLVEPETIPARYTPQGRAEAPEALRGRIQLPAQPPHHGTNHAAQANPCLSGNPNHHLQTTCRHAGAKLIFISRILPVGIEWISWFVCSRLPVAERIGSAGLLAGCRVDLPVHAALYTNRRDALAHFLRAHFKWIVDGVL